MKEYYFKEGGIYYRTNDFVSGRQTIVFMHGLSSSSSAWNEFEERFKNDFNVLTFDLRGHGKSFKPKKYSEYQIKNFSEDFLKLLKYVDIQKFILVSHSFATLIAFEFLADHQDMLSGAVFLSPSTRVAKGFVERLVKYFLDASMLLDLLPFNPKPGKRVEYTPYKGTGDWNVRRLWADVSNTTLRGYLFSTRQSYDFDRDDILESINIPILIIHGAKDSIFPVSNSININKRVRSSELVLLPEADHVIVLNNFKEVSNAISGFLEKISK